MLTATIVGVLTLAASAWVYGQTRLLYDSLPKTVWSLVLTGPINVPSAGTDRHAAGSCARGGGAAPEAGTAWSSRMPRAHASCGSSTWR